MNLLETIQQNLNYPALQKIDTATDKMVEDNNTPNEDKFSQAAIPAILTALYKYVQTDDGASAVLKKESDRNWVSIIFDEHSKEAIEIIASYAKQSNENPLDKMNAIAAEAVKITRENVGEGATIKEIKLFFKDQKNNILLYLLPVLKMGELLNDTTLDDDTNKMEGPISSLMHSLGNVFTNPTTSEEINKDDVKF